MPIPHYRVQFVIPRTSANEITVAIIDAVVTKEELRDKQTFLNALRHALTSWVQETRIGKRAWEQSSHDFNIGDLSHYQDDHGIKLRCRNKGIIQFVVTPYTNFWSGWHYDTVLIDTLTLHI